MDLLQHYNSSSDESSSEAFPHAGMKRKAQRDNQLFLTTSSTGTCKNEDDHQHEFINNQHTTTNTSTCTCTGETLKRQKNFSNGEIKSNEIYEYEGGKSSEFLPIRVTIRECPFVPNANKGNFSFSNGNGNDACVTACRHHFKRSQKHINGNWAGHVYMKIPCSPGNEDDGDDDSNEQERLLCNCVVNTIEHFQEAMMMESGSSSLHSLTTIPANSTARTHQSAVNDNDTCNLTATTHVEIIPHIPIPLVKKSDRNASPIADESYVQNDDSQSQTQHSDSDSDSESSLSDKSSSKTNVQDYHPALHLSLSRPFYLQKQSIQPFLKDLKRRIQISVPSQFICVRVPIREIGMKRGHSKLHPHSRKGLSISLKQQHQQQHQRERRERMMDATILSNDDKTRSFLTVPVTVSGVDPCFIVSLIDSTMKKYGQRVYYENPQFHLSIASWKYNDAVLEQWERLRVLDCHKEVCDCDGEEVPEQLLFPVHGICCDFGTIEKYNIPFGA